MTSTTLAREPAAAPPDRGRPYGIDVRGLTKTYGRRTVVADLDLQVPTGAVAGFVGPNGAGKTTTLRMLLGLVRPDAGTGTVLGDPLGRPRAYLPRVGALIESPAFYPGLSGTRNLEVLATLGGNDRRRIPTVLERVGLAGRGGDPFRTYSLGMKQRLGIAAALLPVPELLILDEPGNGLDPSGIRDMRDLLRGLAADDGSGAPPTVLVSSHLLAEVEQVCGWLVVVEAGRRVYQGPMADVLAGDRTVVLRPAAADQMGALAALLGPRYPGLRRDGAALRLDLTGPDADRDGELAGLNRVAMDAGIVLAELAPRRTSLEDRYARLVQGGQA